MMKPLGGNNNILIHTDSPGYHGVWLEETLFHEACHTSLDARISRTQTWLNAQSADSEFISTYARDFPEREDVAESCLMYYALRHRQDRVDGTTLTAISETIPNRISIFDMYDFQPVLLSDRVAFYNVSNESLLLPAVAVGDEFYEVNLMLSDAIELTFSLGEVIFTSAPNYDSASSYVENMLATPLILAGGQRYHAIFSLFSDDPIQFKITSANLLPW